MFCSFAALWYLRRCRAIVFSKRKEKNGRNKIIFHILFKICDRVLILCLILEKYHVAILFPCANHFILIYFTSLRCKWVSVRTKLAMRWRSSSTGIDFRRQILKSKVGPRTERANYLYPHNIGIKMERKELTKTFMVTSNWKKHLVFRDLSKKKKKKGLYLRRPELVSVDLLNV